MATGEISNSLVLDVDTMGGGSHDKLKIDGRDTLAALEAKHGVLPVTKTSITPSGGTHLHFNYPKNLTIYAGLFNAL